MFEILWELLKMRHRHMIWRNAVRKMVPIDLLNAGLPSNLQTVKKKMHYLQSTVEQMQ